MADITGLLKEAEKLGILNIDVTGDQLSPEVIQTAINATKRLNANAKLDKNVIAQKLQKADRVVAAQHR
jgi:hypothetical protein